MDHDSIDHPYASIPSQINLFFPIKQVILRNDLWLSGAPRAKARGPSTCFRGAEPSEAYPTTLFQSFEG